MGGQKPVNRAGWWKGKFVLFQMLATRGEGGRHLPKGRLLPPHQKARGESFYRQSLCVCWGWGELRAETAQSSLTVIFSMAISGLTGITFVVLGTVNLQFRGALVLISLQSVLRIMAAQVLGTAWLSCS